MRGKWIADLIYKKVFGLEKYLRRKGAVIGDRCKIYSDISTTESYLITIGSDTTISNDVSFITHDNSVCKVCDDWTDVFGSIAVGDRCFIGSRSTILYGVSLANNTIVAAGSVVTKSVGQEGMIIAGNPARIIGKVDDFRDKMESYAVNLEGLSGDEKRTTISNSRKITKGYM